MAYKVKQEFLMKKLLLIFTSCIILGMFFASCKTTRETVPAQSAIIEGESSVEPYDTTNAK